MKTIDEKINEIVEEYSCYDVHGEGCDDDCDNCGKILKEELLELVEIVKNTKTEHKGTVEELTQIFNDIVNTYDGSVIEEAYHEARLWEYD